MIPAGDSNATLALLELVPREDLKEVFEPKLYMDVQMLVMCDGRERGKVQMSGITCDTHDTVISLYTTHKANACWGPLHDLKIEE